MQAFMEIFKYRDLCYMLLLRDIRIRYKQAAMGFIWAIFMPVIAISSGILIKKAMAVVSGKPMDASSLVTITFKVLPWTFFVSSIRFAVQSLVGNSSLITKIYFPRAVLPFSAIAACFFDFLIALTIVPILMIAFGISANAYFWFIPLLLVCLILFTAGVGMLLAAANLFYRDVRYVVEVILMFGIFFTPVFYDASALGKYKAFALYNPIGSILESINQIVVYQQPPDSWLLAYIVACAVVIFSIGFSIFHTLESKFAENI